LTTLPHPKIIITTTKKLKLNQKKSTFELS
jgi:hypothetical protein